LSMTTIASTLELFQAAFPMIGARIPGSIEAETPEAQTARATYEIFVKDAMSRHAWSFATNEETLTYAGEVSSIPAHKYALPADILRPRRVLLNGVQFLDFEIRKGALLCNLKDSDCISMVYNFRAHESEWPADFVDAMIHKLAARLATGLLDRARQGAALDAKAEMLLRRASRADRRAFPGRDPDVQPKLVRAWRGGTNLAKAS